MRTTLRCNRPAPPLPVKTFLTKPVVPATAKLRRIPARQQPILLGVFTTLLFTFSAVLTYAQNYTSIVVFGDSLSDTGNVADLTQAKYGFRLPGPGPDFEFDYTDGRFTDGTDTIPPARNYFGVWVEQLAATFPAKPVVKASLDGGTDYAYGFAKTGSGTGVFTFGPGDELSVNVNNIGQQITDYLATKPRINEKTLFIVWGGAIDILNATSNKDVINAALDQALNIQRLIQAGATQFIIPNLPPLGAVPRLNGSPATSIPATKATVLFNQILGAGIAILRDFNPGRHLNLVQLNVFGLFNHIIGSPSTYALVDVTTSSQGISTINPDTYLFWDDLHPTTRGHNIVAVTASKLIAPQEIWTDSLLDERSQPGLVSPGIGGKD
jgi:phospholipase/lecithinase/hemolysin